MASALLQNALAGDLRAQRELADCLASGCEGIAADRALACAWRIVIVAGAVPGVSATDVEKRRLACEDLSPPEQRQAVTQAQSIFRQIHGRELVFPADFFGGPARAR